MLLRALPILVLRAAASRVGRCTGFSGSGFTAARLEVLAPIWPLVVVDGRLVRAPAVVAYLGWQYPEADGGGGNGAWRRRQRRIRPARLSPAAHAAPLTIIDAPPPYERNTAIAEQPGLQLVLHVSSRGSTAAAPPPPPPRASPPALRVEPASCGAALRYLEARATPTMAARGALRGSTPRRREVQRGDAEIASCTMAATSRPPAPDVPARLHRRHLARRIAVHRVRRETQAQRARRRRCGLRPSCHWRAEGRLELRWRPAAGARAVQAALGRALVLQPPVLRRAPGGRCRS